MRAFDCVSWILALGQVTALRQRGTWEVLNSTQPVLERRDEGEYWQNPPRIANFEVEAPLEGLPKTPNASFKRTKYGPITLQPKSHVDEFVTQVPKPCTDCFITAFQTELVFKNDQKANLNNGVQLRHMILYNTNKRDLVCEGDMYPFPARIHASNNQREVSRLNPGNAPYGMEIGPKDSFSMVYNVTNDGDKENVVYIQMVYETIDKPKAQGYRPATMAWIDLTGCGSAALPDRPGAYSIRSPPWRAKVSGKVLEAVGHISDGGTDISLLVNGQPICTHNVLYGKKYGFMESDANMQHITEISVCRRFGHIREGDEVAITAGFDSHKHPIMSFSHGGSHMMAMSRVYLTDGL